MSDMSDVTKDKLIADVKLVIADTEELLRATAGQTGDKIADIRAKTQDRLAAGQDQAGRSRSRRGGQGQTGRSCRRRLRA